MWWRSTSAATTAPTSRQPVTLIVNVLQGKTDGDAALDQAVEGVAGEASECASGGDGEVDGHAGSFES